MDPYKLFAVYTKQQEKCQSFAADPKEPITEATMTNMGLTHIIATGLMTAAYHEWKHFQDGNKIRSQFKEHFYEAFNELQVLSKITTGGI